MADLDPNVNWDYINNLMNHIREMYPTLAWMLAVPELADLLIKAGMENWEPGRIKAAIEGTQWWKDRNQSARNFEEQLNSDPATAEQQVQSLKTQVLQFARQNNMNVSDAEALFIARDSLRLGRTQQEWQASVVGKYGAASASGASPTAQQLKALAAQYAVPMSDATLQKWVQDMLTGMVDQNTFRAYLIEQAKSLFPSLANALDRGITVQQYVAPYQEIAAQELGINVADIDWTDPKWSTAIHRIDPKTGQPVSMSLSDWQKELRTNPIYGFDQTTRAKDQATALGQNLLERLGFAA